MEYQIWQHLIQILSFRKDLIDTIKPFFLELNNNIKKAKFHINEIKHIPFLQLLSNFQLKVLYEYKIIDVIHKEDISLRTTIRSEEIIKDRNEERVEEIIKNDNIEEMRKIINEIGIKAISPITKSFNEVEIIKIPIIIECIINLCH